jgi:uncharacterized membrane protein YphA (DoxX/SURF4 family)
MRRVRRRSDDEPDRNDPPRRGGGYPDRAGQYGASQYNAASYGPGRRSRWRANGWPVLPLRLFLAALFGFAGYAKFSYPRFFDPASPNGFKAAVDAARDNTPLGGLMGPLADHASFFGHLTAIAEIAIGLGLLVGLLTRIAALGGMVLTAMIVLSINWGGVKEYTGSSGWFTSVELAVAAALSVFLLGGPGPLALDNLFIRARERQRARDDAEPSFRESDLEDSRRRLQGEPVPAGDAATTQLPTAQLPAGQYSGNPPGNHPSGAGHLQDEEYRDDPEPEPNSLWTEGRRASGQPPAGESRRDG